MQFFGRKALSPSNATIATTINGYYCFRIIKRNPFTTFRPDMEMYPILTQYKIRPHHGLYDSTTADSIQIIICWNGHIERAKIEGPTIKIKKKFICLDVYGEIPGWAISVYWYRMIFLTTFIQKRESFKLWNSISVSHTWKDHEKYDHPPPPLSFPTLRKKCEWEVNGEMWKDADNEQFWWDFFFFSDLPFFCFGSYFV